jgi:ribonuclease D
LSYLKLVEQLCGVTLEKGETRSDWLQRPLSESQRHYAADDVRYLLPIFEVLNAKLDASGRRPWLDADCQRAAAAAAEEAIDANPHLGIRTNQALDRPAQLRLRRVLRWRDQRAIEKNKPKRWIIDNDVAFALCRNAIAGIDELDAVLARFPKSPKGARNHLFALLQKPFDAEELQAPVVNEPAQTQKAQLKALQQAVADIAKGLDVPDGLLCSRKHLEYLLETGSWPPALQGWRKELLQDDFGRILPPA